MDKKKYVMPEKEFLPVHVGIIMDGNGRWAKKRLLPRKLGHRAGAETVKKIVRFASDSGIKVLTLYAFSTENWSRPEDEVSALMSLIIEFLRRELEEMNRNGVVIRTIGDIDGLPADVRNLLVESGNNTRNNKGMVLNLALNYGFRKEMVKAVKQISGDCCSGKILEDDIDEKLISKYLYTSDVPDPDLIIRTSGEERLSNFLMYQAAYSELYFTDVLWPDFDENEFTKAMVEYSGRQRRYGKV